MSVLFRRRITRCVGALLASCLSSSSLHAQDGNTDPAAYTHYLPAACAEAVQRTIGFDRRAFEDTAYLVITTDHRIARDTALTRTIEVAHACTDKLALETVPVRDLLPLVSVYLVTNNDSLALQLVRRRLMAARDSAPDYRVFLISRAIEAFIFAKPVRLQHVAWLLNQLDTIDTQSAIGERISRYANLAHYYWQVRDDSSMRTAAERAIQLGKQADDRTRQEKSYPLYNAYTLLVDNEFERTGQPSAAFAVLARVRTDLGPSFEEPMLRDSTRYSHIGKPLRRFAADYWFEASGDTIFPRAGRNTLIVFSPTRAAIAVLRRLLKHADDSDDSLDVIIVQETQGHFLGQLMTPADEARAWEKYYHHELGFSGIVAVTTTPFGRKPDGRVVAQPSSLNREYTMSTATMIVDTQGIVRFAFANSVSPDFESRLQDALRQVSGK